MSRKSAKNIYVNKTIFVPGYVECIIAETTEGPCLFIITTTKCISQNNRVSLE